MQGFEEIETRAVLRKGGPDAFEALINTGAQLVGDINRIPDDRFLAAMTKSIFQAGFAWKVIEAKWDGFETAFNGFDIGHCLFLSPDDLDELAKDTRIVRNPQKIATVPANAKMIADQAGEHGSFGAFLEDWPKDDFVGLLAFLNKNGSRLGGATSQYFLRFVGYDGFILTRDGTRALIEAGVVDKAPTGKGALARVQEAYNRWRAETGYSYARISRILAMSTGD